MAGSDENGEWVCPIDGSNCYSETSWGSHCHAFHDGFDPRFGADECVCLICSRHFVNLQVLGAHVRFKHPDIYTSEIAEHEMAKLDAWLDTTFAYAKHLEDTGREP